MGRVDPLLLPEGDLSDAYENGAHIPGAEGYPPRWAAEAGAFRAAQEGLGRAWLNLPYGAHPRERLDLFVPRGRPEGLIVFIHGGYWKAFGRETWSHLAAGPMARGWAVAMPSYVLAPEARIGAIGRAMAAAAEAAGGRVAGPLVLTGHSAGGQLSARLAMPGALSPALAERLARCVPISPVGELSPLMATAMNETLGIDAAEAAAESPARLPPPAAPVTVWVGEAERPAFLAQARHLAGAWGAALQVDEGRHHFDVIEPLADEGSALTRALCGA